MAVCDDRQLTEAQRQAGYQNQRTGVQQAVRPFSGRPTIENLIDYINRELQPAVRRTRDAVNDVYLQVADNAPSGNPLGFYFSTDTTNADPTAGRIRLNQATQDTATIIRVSESNGRLVNVAPWLDVMAGGATTPLGVVTLTDAINPSRFIRFDLDTMADLGAYWNLGVTPIESSHDNPFVDSGAVVLSFIPGVGGTTPATVPPSSISGADGPRQFLSTSTGTTVDWRTLSATFPGAPIYDVMAYPFNAVGDGSADDTAAINAAIAAANAAPGAIYLGRGHRITAALTTITGNNISLFGRGEFNGGTIIRIDAAILPAEVLLVTGQYALIQDIWFGAPFQGLNTTSYALRLNSYRPTVRNVVVSMFGNGINIDRSNTAYLENCQITDVLGSYGYYVHGQAPDSFCHNTQFERCGVGQSFPLAIGAAPGAWASGTAYAVGDIVLANGGLWQASSAGTSAGAGSGPSGLPSTNPSLVHSATVTDGTVQWRFAMGAYAGFAHGSFAHTVMYERCGVLQGRYGLHIFDDQGDAPTFIHAWQFSVDHPFDRGILIEACDGAVWFEQTLVGSILSGAAVELQANAVNWQFHGGEVGPAAREGFIVAGNGGKILGVQVDGCSIQTANTYDGIAVAAGVTDIVIDGCTSGDIPGRASQARYGISIGAGADNYIITNNVCVGNNTGGILNTPGRSDTRVVMDNVPDLEFAPGSSWGLQIDHGAADVPREITGLEQGENLRLDTLVTDTSTSGSASPYSVAAQVNWVRFNSLTGTYTLNGCDAVASGKIIIWHVEPGVTGSLVLVHNNGAITNNQRFFCPGAVDLTLRSGETAITVQTTNRQRVLAVSRSNNITDGDKGDITVSVGGTVWTIDNNVVSDAKLRDSVGFSVIGRAGTGTGDPADIVIADNSVIGRAGAAGTGDIEPITVPGTGTLTGEVVFLQSSSLRNHVRWSNFTLNALPEIGNLKFVGNVSGATSRPIYTDLAQLAQDLFGIGFDTATHNFRLTDMAQSRIKGRAEGAGTGVPTDLTPTQVVAIIDGEAVAWTANHSFTSATHTVTTTGGITLDSATTTQVNGTNFTVSTSNNVTIGAGATTTIAGGTEVQITSPTRLSSSVTLDAVTSTATTAANNLAIGVVSVVRFTGPPSPLTGMVAVYDGQTVLLVNAHASTDMVILLEATGSSSAANCFAGSVTDRHIKPGEMALAWYDGTSDRWRLLLRDDVDL